MNMARMDKLSTYRTTIAQAGDLTAITYHSTQIVAFDRHNVSLRTGGWDSVTTRRKMNQAANQFGLGYSVYRDKGASYVRTPAGAVRPLEDNMTFSRI
jgi:hypothetical protein